MVAEILIKTLIFILENNININSHAMIIPTLQRVHQIINILHTSLMRTKP